MAVSICSTLTTALAFLLLLSYSAAFVGPHSFTLVPHRQQANQKQKIISQDIASIPSLGAKNNNKNNNDDDLEKERAYTKIDDGSPLGVAIVGIGGLLYTTGGDTFSFLQDSSNAVWIILATASTAAGLSRLVRYINDKQTNSDQ
mmetsp:Transcript_9041/g.14948  ORF Transcript_9041/g.14948 Transcript_9041/m.14948 type:complete len:145 (+) Transcript_9041:38-472(+)